ncbi:MAG: DUF2330 domain-containing protein [Candidatus Bathyarchaeota archaeon]|nr:DUF2330 domain-containing protein [Candidatus Bathyarchaeota archaeon]
METEFKKETCMLSLRRVSIGIVFFLLVLFSVSFVYADRGLITVSPEVSVYEPGQKAVVAWNGQEEILILSTDVTSSSETLVLELLPLPSEPEVEAASFRSFEEIQRLIWEEGVNLYMGRGYDEIKANSVEVVFHEEIGAHNITVVKATDAGELVDWIENFLQTNNVNETVSLGDFEPVVKDYMGRGFRYYVLDLITVTPDEKSVDPILYWFRSSFLYYPLVITSPVPGETEITLFLLTEGKVDKNYQPMRRAYYQVWGTEGWKPIEFILSKGDLSKIDLRIGELFDEGAWLTVLTYEGSLSWLTRDLMISEEAPNLATPVNVEVTLPSLSPSIPVDVEVILPSTLIALCILLGATCTLAGVVCTFLITRSEKKTGKSG